ncbi:MAG: hypothetical protein AAGD25_40550, partial [Cyanobacteria bacterium P01_F01_bin.150]
DYIAYWLQAGKRLFYPAMPDGHKFTSILNGSRYSQEFEACWEQVCEPSSAGDAYLEGTAQTIKELLSSEWEIIDCARCDMPIPMVEVGTYDGPCPCHDLELWPNTDLPQPRSPIDSNRRLLAIQTRLLATSIVHEHTVKTNQTP